MANMSYCRFRNTLTDLSDCQYWLEAMIHDDEVAPLSREELVAAKELVKACFDIVQVVCEADNVDLADEPDLAKIVEKFNQEAAKR